MGRHRLLLSIPCPKHGLDPCPSASGCNARRLAAGLEKRKPGRPGKSGTSGHERGHPERRRKKVTSDSEIE